MYGKIERQFAVEGLGAGHTGRTQFEVYSYVNNTID